MTASRSLPPTMHAARVAAHGGVEAVAWCEVDRPQPGPGEVLVELRTAGVNHLDLWVRRGVPGHSFPLPLTLGSDGAGTVAAHGPGTEAMAVGTDVIISPGVADATSREALAGNDHLARDYQILGEGRFPRSQIS